MGRGPPRRPPPPIVPHKHMARRLQEKDRDLRAFLLLRTKDCFLSTGLQVCVCVGGELESQLL